MSPYCASRRSCANICQTVLHFHCQLTYDIPSFLSILSLSCCLFLSLSLAFLFPSVLFSLPNQNIWPLTSWGDAIKTNSITHLVTSVEGKGAASERERIPIRILALRINFYNVPSLIVCNGTVVKVIYTIKHLSSTLRGQNGPATAV